MNVLQSTLAVRAAAPPMLSKQSDHSEVAAQFGELLGSLIPEQPDQQASEQLPLADITSALAQLAELPSEQLTEKQKELQYAIFQLLGDTDGEQLAAAVKEHSSDEKTQQRLLALLEQVKSVLLATKEFAQPGPFTGVTEKEFPAAEQTPIKAMRPLVELLEQLEQPLALTEKMILLKESIPQKPETRLAFAQAPQSWLHITTRAMAEAADKPLAPLEQAEPALPELNSNIQPEQHAQPAKAEILPQAAIMPASVHATKPVDTAVRQVPVQKLADTLSEWIASPARLSTAGNETRLRINIFPEHLGHLEILVSVAGGKLTAQITVSQGAAKEAVELQLNQLRLSLGQQGVEIERLEVREDRSPQEFQQQPQRREPRFSNPSGSGGAGSGSGEQLADDVELAKQHTNRPSAATDQVNYTV
ncbi:flagellar hook-length control protein FliK [Planococcus dechangensis]|uniref:Flagellar hook-length control protein FliK n=1 Tax=Planococcus dechangensis TaxID=1176255 RepID=A0ABV9M964_9BACL